MIRIYGNGNADTTHKGVKIGAEGNLATSSLISLDLTISLLGINLHNFTKIEV